MFSVSAAHKQTSHLQYSGLILLNINFILFVKKKKVSEEQEQKHVVFILHYHKKLFLIKKNKIKHLILMFC